MPECTSVLILSHKHKSSFHDSVVDFEVGRSSIYKHAQAMIESITKHLHSSHIKMPVITHYHTHTFADGEPIRKACQMTFQSNDAPALKREKESVFEHPTSGETHTHRFVMTKLSQKINRETFSDDTEDGYDSEDVERYRSY